MTSSLRSRSEPEPFGAGLKLLSYLRMGRTLLKQLELVMRNTE
jgi:hypothetical protein